MPSRTARRAAKRANKSSSAPTVSLMERAKARAEKAWITGQATSPFTYNFFGVVQTVIMLLHNDAPEAAIERRNSLLKNAPFVKTLQWGGEMVTEALNAYPLKHGSEDEVFPVLINALSSVFEEPCVAQVLPGWMGKIERDLMVDTMVMCLHTAAMTRVTERLDLYTTSIRTTIVPGLKVSGMEKGIVELIEVVPDSLQTEQLGLISIGLSADLMAPDPGRSHGQKIDDNSVSILLEYARALAEAKGPQGVNAAILASVAFGGMLMPLIHLARQRLPTS